MKNYASAFLILGSSLLGGCYLEPQVNLLSCTGVPKIVLKSKTVSAMSRDELTAFYRYKAWFIRNCSQQQNDYSVRAFDNLSSTLR